MGAVGGKGCCSGNTEENMNNEVEFQENEKTGMGELTRRSNENIENLFLQNKSISFKDNFPTNKSLTIANESSENTARLRKLQEIVDTAPILKLKIISSSTLPKGTILSLNAQGLENSFRNAKDGVTFFGCKKKDKPINKQNNQNEIINDFIIPSQDKDIGKRHRGRHFQIDYDIETKAYRIKDLGIGFGAFYKIDEPILLKDNHLLNMGLVFIVVNLSYGQSESEAETQVIKDFKPNGLVKKPLERPALKLKLFGGPCTGEIQVFEPSTKPITIGRMNDNAIVIDDNLLSKNQCKIEYKENAKGWVLSDGKEKPSTNGTWLYLGEQQIIYSGMIFKANQTVFQVKISNS